ncbi:uncharacterized protein LOC133522027 [Cydia pomonella]|uniref:uncharacterized protein LOC133522027 n=1 Tax=Cydia pomonella TaxID=82600 RepID=UPI002ADE3A57|nr:uncharacterized protein LOC133522027 [Cydia pomonella]XP_061713182.1 uncharacterized protein LOC133522027 [Cydia pomonella]
MEISVYNIHHVVAKFLNLREHVYVASDWLVFFCSFLCCQCAEYMAEGMPTDGLSEASSIAYKITPRKLEVDTARSCEELFQTASLKINFDQPVEPCNTGDDRSCSKQRTVEERGELDGKMPPDNSGESVLTKLTNSPNMDKNITPIASSRNDDYPIVHSHRRVSDQHKMVAEFTE